MTFEWGISTYWYSLPLAKQDRVPTEKHLVEILMFPNYSPHEMDRKWIGKEQDTFHFENGLAFENQAKTILNVL